MVSIFTTFEMNFMCQNLVDQIFSKNLQQNEPFYLTGNFDENVQFDQDYFSYKRSSFSSHLIVLALTEAK